MLLLLEVENREILLLRHFCVSAKVVIVFFLPIAHHSSVKSSLIVLVVVPSEL